MAWREDELVAVVAGAESVVVLLLEVCEGRAAAVTGRAGCELSALEPRGPGEDCTRDGLAESE